jgi:hypothetical protein
MGRQNKNTSTNAGHTGCGKGGTAPLTDADAPRHERESAASMGG